MDAHGVNKNYIKNNRRQFFIFHVAVFSYTFFFGKIIHSYWFVCELLLVGEVEEEM